MANSIFEPTKIAPCGICGVCIAYLREKKACPGCRKHSGNKPKHCVSCIIVNFGKLAETQSGFCIDCPEFPCARMKRLDTRYREYYQTSLIGDQHRIKSDGMDAFLESETKKWLCPHCGVILSIHREVSLGCKELIKRKL